MDDQPIENEQENNLMDFSRFFYCQDHRLYKHQGELVGVCVSAEHAAFITSSIHQYHVMTIALQHIVLLLEDKSMGFTREDQIQTLKPLIKETL